MADDFKELIDVLDENGQFVGKQETKEELYQDGHWHRSVHIWIINDKQELLVQKRNPYKKTFPNLWAISTAGHVLAGESSLQAGIRELKEELDLECSKCIVIRTKDVKKGAVVLEKELSTTNYKVIDNTEIRLYDYLENSAKVNKTLLTNGIEITEIYESGISLEDYFNSLIKEGAKKC